MSILCIVKVKIFVLSYRSLPTMLTIELKMVMVFLSMQSILFYKHVFAISFLGVLPNHITLKYGCPIKKSNGLRDVTLMSERILNDELQSSN